jgi:predicted RNA-binding Zn-ribbon protein involved in translation (DUF1610 family)
MMRMKCTNCGINIESEKVWVGFSCPKCGKGKIIRCDRCRKLENQYKCEECGFTGP